MVFIRTSSHISLSKSSYLPPLFPLLLCPSPGTLMHHWCAKIHFTKLYSTKLSHEANFFNKDAQAIYSSATSTSPSKRIPGCSRYNRSVSSARRPNVARTRWTSSSCRSGTVGAVALADWPWLGLLRSLKMMRKTSRKDRKPGLIAAREDWVLTTLLYMISNSTLMLLKQWFMISSHPESTLKIKLHSAAHLLIHIVPVPQNLYWALIPSSGLKSPPCQSLLKPHRRALTHSLMFSDANVLSPPFRTKHQTWGDFAIFAR